MNQIVFAGVAMFLTGLIGCGGGGATGGQPVYPVSGTVTMNGAPLAGATVAFAPQAGQPTALGKTDPEGKFILTTYDYGDGAAAGQFKVVVSKSAPAAASTGGGNSGHGADYKPENSSHDAAGKEGDSGELVPKQYTSSGETPLAAEVKTSGDNTFTFDLQ